MSSLRHLGIGIGVLGLLAIGWAGDAAAASAEKGPPACAAIAFRPVPSGLTDGDQDAGLYKSRFGRIIVKATVQSGEAQNYFVEVDGKKPAAPSGALPSSVAGCAAAKKLSTPAKAAATCTGERLKVLIDHSGKQRYILLYALNGREWRFCSAGTI